jgi:uncharacterized protein (TIGR00251 family)
MHKPASLSARLAVKVVPGSSRDQIVGWLGNALKIKVAAPPDKGRANEAVVELLAKKLGISPNDIQIQSGHASPSKVLEISHLDDAAVKRAFP